MIIYKISIFTSGIWSGIIISGFLLVILYNALSWLSSLEITYASFEKQIDFDKKMNKEKVTFGFWTWCCSIHLYRQKKRTYTKELLGTRKVFAFLVCFLFNIHKELFYKELAFRTFPNPRRILLCTSFRLLLDDGLARKQSK